MKSQPNQDSSTKRRVSYAAGLVLPQVQLYHFVANENTYQVSNTFMSYNSITISNLIYTADLCLF